jgi:hypothetical protein
MKAIRDCQPWAAPVQRDDDQYSEDEERFLATVKAGLNIKPTPLKSIVPKGVPAQSKKKRPANAQ